MDALKSEFKDVRDMVFLTVKGVDVQTENAMRLAKAVTPAGRKL